MFIIRTFLFFIIDILFFIIDKFDFFKIILTVRTSSWDISANKMMEKDKIHI